ncbi:MULTISPECIES: type II toxin-antitoxin system VapC family toxin [unclassified Coleofasciculus]|uniref:type II toxin-antitoxin system VapC family toxin n=1 Tax=unclassified Coleofasciculus TaxID=2692782 RepID=UPI001882142C|nr:MULTISPECIES: PIN domain-containing protein [unclassified Coleofasciculus]MBE9128863.1 PIN domain-containing protein [Coleofasciculus sp. LEGE 07081]MBE9151623.1 PIN domain-containing protein [Coleofasciculus sp. LEGE 07092]
MKVLLDTNIILDYALKREPFSRLADQIFILIEQKYLEGYVSASTFTDLFYILRKSRGKDWALQFLARLVQLCPIATVDANTVKAALTEHYKDFEDDIQYYAALQTQLEGIVTRNPTDFPEKDLRILTPEQLLQELTENQ